MIINTTSEKIYLLGCYQDNEFWCRGEFSSKEKAVEAYLEYCKAQPEKHIALIEQMKLHSILVQQLPKK